MKSHQSCFHVTQAKRIIRQPKVWRKLGDAELQLACSFHPLFIPHSTFVTIRCRKHQMVQTTGMLNTHLYLEYHQSEVLHHANHEANYGCTDFTLRVPCACADLFHFTQWGKAAASSTCKWYALQTQSFRLAFGFDVQTCPAYCNGLSI
jgi:hypothetical protein